MQRTWNEVSATKFNVRSTFFLVEIRSTYLTQHRLIIGSHEEDIFKSLWKINLPKKVAFFVESVFGQTSNETKSQEKTGYAGK